MKKGGISATSIDIDVALQVAELNRQERSVTIWRQQLVQLVLLQLLVELERLLLEVLVRQQVQRQSLLLEQSWLEQQRRIRLKHSQKSCFRMSCIQKMCHKSYILKKQFHMSCIQKMCRKSYILKKQFHKSCMKEQLFHKSYIL